MSLRKPGFKISRTREVAGDWDSASAAKRLRQWVVDFSVYARGFARVAACTHHMVLADPAANAESVLRIARDCDEDGVAVAVFPE